jgi:hypothetical protein
MLMKEAFKIQYWAKVFNLERQTMLMKFSLSWHEKLIFYFLSATNRYFCEGAAKIQYKNWTKTISKNSRPLGV